MSGEIAVQDRKEGPLLSAKELTGLRVRQGEKNKVVGKVHCLVFHPKKRSCVGFLVKRPDVALMFHRKDCFVALDGFSVEDDGIHIRQGDAFEGQAACSRLGLDLDSCVIWQGMPVMTENGGEVGIVDDILVDPSNGRVEAIVPGKGATAKALLGTCTIPRKLIVGFRMGIGDQLNITAGEGDAEYDVCGAIVVSDRALTLDSEGGFAEKAGKAAAVANDKAHRAKAVAKPKVSAAAKATEQAVGKGAFALGRQLSRTKGMFSAFKSEYDKAVSDDAKRTKR
ncbi:MAG: PRC-barrel domain-containing protein [Eggerthellaceae bacterium]